MARLPYVDPDQPALQALAARIRAERGGKMLNLYKMLLHSPPLADGWRQLLTAIRQQGQLAARYRELAILRVAVLNEAPYEFAQHVPFARSEGITEAQLQAMQSIECSAAFDPDDALVIAYTDAMTRQIRVPPALFASLRARFDAREIVELTGTIGAYNMVSRFLEALELEHD